MLTGTPAQSWRDLVIAPDTHWKVFAGRVDEKDLARGGVPIAEIHPELGNNSRGDLKLQPFSWELFAERGVEVLFLTPRRAIA